MVGFATEHTAADSASDGAHETTVTFLAVGVIGALLTVLVTLLGAGGRGPGFLLAGVALVALGLAAGERVRRLIVGCAGYEWYLLVEAAGLRRTLATALVVLSVLGLLAIARLLSAIARLSTVALLLAIALLLAVALLLTVALVLAISLLLSAVAWLLAIALLLAVAALALAVVATVA